MIYVDQPIYKKSPNGRKSYAHMIADNFEELHEFAAKIGVKKHFFHSKSLYKHYDITSDQHAIALENGAILLTDKATLIEKCRALMAQLKK